MPSTKDISPRRRDGLRILRTLSHSGFDARFAGGCVRDRLLKKEASDYDIATTALPEEVCLLFRQKNIKVVPTGIAHGTVSVILPSGPYELTTLRRDVATDGRHALVQFGQSFMEDAARRDFTVNAMFEDADGQIYDFFQGQEDLAARHLRFVGEAAQRIREDYLRMLRFFRFLAQLDFQPDPDAITAIRAAAPQVSVVSQERITAEMLKMLATPNPEASLRLMAETGLLAILLPQAAWTPAWQELSQRLAALPPALRALARLSLFYRQQEQALQEQAGAHWKLSAMDGRLLRLFARGPNLWPEKNDQRSLLMEWLDRYEKEAGGQEALEMLLKAWALLYPDKHEIIAKLSRCEASHGAIRRRKLPVDGRMLMERLGVTAGPQLGELLLWLRQSFRDERWKSAEEALAMAQAWLGKKEGNGDE